MGWGTNHEAETRIGGSLKALREELNEAKWAGQGHDIRFNLNNVEVEFQTVVEMEGGGKVGGKIKFWVLDIDAELNGKYKNAVTQKIKLNLTPVDEKNPDPDTGKPGVVAIATRK